MTHNKLYMPQRLEIELDGFDITFEDYLDINETQYQSLISDLFKIKKVKFLEKKGEVQ